MIGNSIQNELPWRIKKTVKRKKKDPIRWKNKLPFGESRNQLPQKRRKYRGYSSKRPEQILPSFLFVFPIVSYNKAPIHINFDFVFSICFSSLSPPHNVEFPPETQIMLLGLVRNHDLVLRIARPSQRDHWDWHQKHPWSSVRNKRWIQKKNVEHKNSK